MKYTNRMVEMKTSVSRPKLSSRIRVVSILAALIIPGSGINQSSRIYGNDPSNYHFGIMEALGSSFNKYVLIKPNEDCLAFHNGRQKLNNGFIINWLLDHEAFYSAHYITSSLAITKFLQDKYDKVVVAGLSQGGAAALLIGPPE